MTAVTHEEGEVLELERRQLPSAEAVLDLARCALGAREVRCEEGIVPEGTPPTATLTFGTAAEARAFFAAMVPFLPRLAYANWPGDAP